MMSLTILPLVAASLAQENQPVKITQPQKSVMEALPQSLRWEKESAWMPEKGEFYLSLFEMHYAPTSWLTLHTITFPWALSGSSLGVRFPLWQSERLSLVGSVSYFSIDLGRVAQVESDGISSKLSFVPMAINGSWRWTERFLIGASIRHNEFIVGGGTISTENDTTIDGVASTTNTHLRLQASWAMSDKWSFWMISNHLLNQSLELQNYNEVELENGATVELFLEAESAAVNFANSHSIGTRFLRRGNRWMLSIGADVGRPPLYLLGSVTTIRVLPNFTTGFYF